MRLIALLGAMGLFSAGCAEPSNGPAASATVQDAEATTATTRESPEKPLVVEVDKEGLQATLDENSVTLVDFTATWCGPCQALKPELHKMAEEFSGKARFVEVDVDKSVDLAQMYEIQAMPTLLVIRDGKVHSRIVGAGDIDGIRHAIKAAM